MPGPRTHTSLDPSESYAVSLPRSRREWCEEQREKLGLKTFSAYVRMLIDAEMERQGGANARCG